MFGKLRLNSFSVSKEKANNNQQEECQKKPNEITPSMPNKTKFIKKDQKHSASKNPLKPKILFQNKSVKPKNSLNLDLQGSKFRLLNQILYTSTSKQAIQHFKNHKQDFQTYHKGYRKQSEKWQVKPVDHIIQFILKNHKRYRNKSFIDLGCGDGFIQENIGNKFNIQSFDLVSNKPFIKVADSAHLPVQDNSKDVAIFCLSLMGVNYLDFLIEAKRVLKSDGQMIIAEVESRSSNWQNFSRMVQSLGFRLIYEKEVGYFRKLIFKVNQQNMKKGLKIKGKQIGDLKQFSREILTPCLYKKR